MDVANVSPALIYRNPGAAVGTNGNPTAIAHFLYYAIVGAGTTANVGVAAFTDNLCRNKATCAIVWPVV